MVNSVLIIDDVSWGSAILAKSIKSHSNDVNKVDVAKTIELAINLIETNEYDVIFCDLMMPPEKFVFNGEILCFDEPDYFNGRKIVEYCMKRGISRRTKIIITSQASIYSQKLVETFNHEIDMLSKPFLLKELLKKI